MKKNIRTFLVALLVVFISGTAKSQTADEIIEKHIKAHGGLEKWEAIKSMKITGQFTSFSETKEFVHIKTQYGKYYGKFHLGKFEVTEAFDGETGWTIDPWQDIDFPRRVNKVERNTLMQKAEFCTPFFEYKNRGHKVEYLGKEDIEGTETYALKLTRPNGMWETWYLDSKTYLELKCVSQWTDFAWPGEATAFFDDFREVGGLLVPFYTERTFSIRHRVTEIENIELNTEIDMTLFDMPESVEILKLKPFIGEWDVEVFGWSPNRKSWYPFAPTSSKIESVANNMLQETIEYERIFPIRKTINYTYNNETNNYRMAVYNDFSSRLNVFEGGFTDTTFVVNNKDINYGSEGEKKFIQFEFSEITDDSFILEIESSDDEGSTWNPRDRFIYTRKK